MQDQEAAQMEAAKRELRELENQKRKLAEEFTQKTEVKLTLMMISLTVSLET